MFIFYLFACIPITIGFLLWWKNKRVVWQEWLGGSAAAIVFTAIFHVAVIWGMTGDTETWSGEITKVSHHPQWVERWIKHHSETYYTGTGKNRVAHTRHWTTTEYDTHYEHWVAHVDFGSYVDWNRIDESLFNEISANFGGNIFNDGKQAYNHMGTLSSGDRNIYSVANEKGYMYPVTSSHSFENRVKASPSVFSFIKVPTNVAVYPYPENKNWMVSDRLIGTAVRDFDITLFDRMNSRLGPLKKVNVILVGFDTDDTMISEYQKAAWVGGKKNDLVICYGKGWSRVFGWTESELVKQNLQSLVIEYPKNNDLIPIIEKEIRQSYKIKDWSKFDYLSVEPTTSHYVWFVILMMLTQGGLYVWFHLNEFVQGKTVGETVDEKHAFGNRITRYSKIFRSR